jgi:hypothetical protein
MSKRQKRRANALSPAQGPKEEAPFKHKKQEKQDHAGRRPADGSFPACPKSGICRAQSIRNHSACRNCALSDTSLQAFLRHQGTPAQLFEKLQKNCHVCLDLLTRVVDSCQEDQDQEAPDFEKVALILYHYYGKGNVAPRYLGQALKAPRPGDQAHARMILEELHLTCYAFNFNTEKCQYIEDLVYCKRHTPILSPNQLNKMCAKYERSRNRKRKYPSPVTISQIKEAILEHESQFQEVDSKFKEIALRKRFNAWLRKLSTN